MRRYSWETIRRRIPQRAEKIADDNNHMFTSSTVNIRNTTDKITIRMPKEAEHVNIRAVAINNTENYSAGRFLFHCAAAGLILLVLFLLHGGKQLKPERIFLTVSLCVGSLLILLLPVHKVGLDEEIHFGRAYYLFDTLLGRETITVTPAMNDLIQTSMNNWPYSIPQSEEEYKQEEAFWNSNLSWDSQKPSDDNQQNNYGFQMYSFQLSSAGADDKGGTAFAPGLYIDLQTRKTGEPAPVLCGHVPGDSPYPVWQAYYAGACTDADRHVFLQ